MLLMGSFMVSLFWAPAHAEKSMNVNANAMMGNGFSVIDNCKRFCRGFHKDSNITGAGRIMAMALGTSFLFSPHPLSDLPDGIHGRVDDEHVDDPGRQRASRVDKPFECNVG